MSSPKEPPFFQVEYELGPAYYWNTYFRGIGGKNTPAKPRITTCTCPT